LGVREVTRGFAARLSVDRQPSTVFRFPSIVLELVLVLELDAARMPSVFARSKQSFQFSVFSFRFSVAGDDGL
jgi:hypothetical protein